MFVNRYFQYARFKPSHQGEEADSSSFAIHPLLGWPILLRQSNFNSYWF